MGRKRCADKRMEQIYQVIRNQIIAKGYPPSVREIGTAVGLKSSSTVHGYLNQLEEAGMIRRDPAKPRAIDILEAKPWDRTATIPLVKDAAGITAEAAENIEESFAFPTTLLGTKSDCFMMRSADDSMTDAGIKNNDFLMVQRQTKAENGDIVVAVDHDGAAVIRRYARKGTGAELQPANADYASIAAKKPDILGKVIGIYHQL